MARKDCNGNSGIDSAVIANLLEKAISSIDQARVADVLSREDCGVLAYLLNMPMFIPINGEIITIKRSKNIGICINVNKTNSTCEIIYATKVTKYFKTTEDKETFEKGGKVDYNGWEWHEDEDHKEKGERYEAYSSGYYFVDIEPLNCPVDAYEMYPNELKVINDYIAKLSN